MPNLTGKVAIITGSTKGIGLAIVERMINEGASVVVSSRTGSDIESITERLGDRAVGIVCDVADPEACQRLVDETVEGPRATGRPRQQRGARCFQADHRDVD
jgi:NAD(P)-dependent dehydrogenase (short-subunit alcohol dehydrogenase family)